MKPKLLGRVSAAMVVLALAASTSAAAAAPASHAAPDEGKVVLLVGLDVGADRPAIHAEVELAEVVGGIAQLAVDVVAVPSDHVDAAVASYRRQPGVRYVERDSTAQLLSEPDDPRLSQQYALERISMLMGWERYGRDFLSRSGAVVAVIDSGIDGTHAEFSGRIKECRRWGVGDATSIDDPLCLDSIGHGSHVAGVIGATSNNGIGIAGIAFDAELLSLAVDAPLTGEIQLIDVAAATVYATDAGADVINYSLSAAGDSRVLREAISYAHERGVVQVAAAGNLGRSNSVTFPARYYEVIAVSATTREDALAAFSSRGSEVDVAAPGEDIISTLSLPNDYRELSGTSMAAPHVAGLAALLSAQGLDAGDVRDRIAGCAYDLGSTGADPLFGHGRINAGRALDVADPCTGSS